MINLLDSDTQKQYRAARSNTKLRRYVLLMSSVALGVFATFAIGTYITMNERKIAEQELAQAQQSVSGYAAVKKEAETYADNLKIAKAILSQEVLYSDMVTQIAKTLPSSAVLGSLSIDQDTLTKPLTLDAKVKNKDAAVTLKNTLEASPIFEDVNINTIIENPVTKDTKEIDRMFPVAVKVTMKATKGQPGSLLP